jgi:hypothetical protein
MPRALWLPVLAARVVAHPESASVTGKAREVSYVAIPSSLRLLEYFILSRL